MVHARAARASVSAGNGSFPVGAQRPSGEAGRRGDAVSVGVGGGAADLFAVGEAVVGVGHGFQAGEPFLEGQVVGESGGVVT